MILSIGSSREEAEQLVRRLQKALVASPMSMSFGVASFPEDGVDSESLLKIADSRLYKLKAKKIPEQRSSHVSGVKDIVSNPFNDHD